MTKVKGINQVITYRDVYKVDAAGICLQCVF